ncbi:putative late blight resistance protein homolog R1B-17 [Salvia hispanica]|uniref:putative late blight resistance protein homolog R1B-17 n=1 Tax=Salvia hispanica TaxID=49212 RepID=UPI0020098A7B|nr:putative late blight resistance protein homolog R1B-17 [Salvia hispanica]
MSAEAEIVKFLLELLMKEWTGFRNLKLGAPNEFKNLKAELAKLEAFLQQEQRVNFLVENKIRNLYYEVEDAIELWLTKKDVAKNKGWFNRMKGVFSTEIEQKMKLLRKEIPPIMDEIKKENIEREQIQPAVNLIKQESVEIKENKYSPSTSSQVQIPIPVPVKVTMVHEEKQGVGAGDILEMDQSFGAFEQSSWKPSDLDNNLVSFQEEDSIINKLLDPSDRLEVISITGMAGIGKTTLARKIYKHQMVVTRFKFRFWIHVSENFNLMEALRYIMNEIAVKAMVLKDEGVLMNSVKGSLKNKEFLLVVDSVWSMEDWARIKAFLPNDRGKVLLTTCDADIASSANVYREPYRLGGLSQEASFELLILQVFDKVEDCDKELIKVGNDIAKRCDGMPLVIKLIGGFLKRIVAKIKPVTAIEDEWLKVLTTVNEILNQDPEKSISDLLDMSYKRLDHDQRTCFLYSGLFPENHEIPVSTLTQLWIAEGFIKWREGDNESLEEKAEKILNVLIQMNLLTVTKKDLEQVKTCLAHDMIREFCRNKAKEENLFQVINGSIGGGPDPPNAKPPEFRRLCFNSDPTEFLTNCPKDLTAKRVRSLLCFYKESIQQTVTFPEVCYYLRVLNCRSTKFLSFPAVKKLILLKHITLHIENLQVLPKYISHLVNLQTLIVDTKLQVITIQSNISKMIRLRRFKTKAAIFLDDKKWKAKACHKLQTFSRLSPESCKQVLAKRAPHLKALGVRGKLTNLADVMFLKDFRKLEKLKLMNDLDDQSKPSPFLVELNLFCPPNLTSLTLVKTGTDLKWDVHMHLLAKMEKLRILKLKDNAFTGEEWIVDEADIFPCLEFLLIEKSGLVKWIASKSNFPKLRSLVIKNCEELSEIPESPSEHLESLEIDLVKKSIVESAKRIEEIQTEQNQNRTREIPFKLTTGARCDLRLISETINPRG